MHGRIFVGEIQVKSRALNVCAFFYNKKLREPKPVRDAHSCHITNIEPLAP